MKDELVRINEKGEIHPIGHVAGEQLRLRPGAFRMLPAPAHVVFLRYTGEDGRRDAEDGAVVRLAGEITAPAAVCDILAMMEHARWRGELHVLSSDGERCIFMDNGNVVGCTTNLEEERIGQVMFRFGALSEAQRVEALGRVTDGVRFGEAAVTLGFVTPEEQYHFVGKQIESIVFGAFEVSDGTFFFLDGFDPAKLVSQHTIATNMLLMDGVTRLDEMRYFRQKIPTSDWVPALTELRSEPAEGLAEVLAAVDGLRSVAEVGRLTERGEFDATKALYSLAQSKHLQMHPPRIAGGANAIVQVANGALRQVYARVQEAGKETLLRETLAEFSSGNIFELLFRGAGPDKAGAFDPDAVCQNLPASESETFLMARLREYLSFALFSAGHALGAEAESELRAELSEYLQRLMPPG